MAEIELRGDGLNKCPKCGVFVKDTKFCPGCGKSLKKWCCVCKDWKWAWHPAAHTDISGSGPGDPFVRESEFCDDCGTKLERKEAPQG